MSAPAMGLPTAEDLCVAINGTNTDDPVSASIAAMFPLHQMRFLCISTLADDWTPLEVSKAKTTANRLATAVLGTTLHIHAIDLYIAASVQLTPSQDAEVSEYTIGEFAAQIGYVATVAYAERKAGQDRGNEARLAALFDAYEKFRAALLSGTSRLPQRTPPQVTR